MNFINIIVENSKEKIAKLYKPAIKANDNPENGITIQNKSAYYVIKDCAEVAKDYIPLIVFETYKNPFEDLMGKFTKEDIAEFLIFTKTNIASKHLLLIISEEYNKLKTKKINKPDTIHIMDSSDPYGEYGSESFELVNTSDSSSDSPFNILCEAFGVNN
jgi:hypothetical protein